ncbi:hypothetical protein PAHAL_7G334800 [Panicum hallii]|jgi:hypothetical protein|uniref:Uncharacterized protein n=1 Tax=Panicum hallii TaxID=206008 RepID=A0A2T8IEB6_9POAL|nr:protein BPS1, chloroplastic-like [Panicum hallii]PVH36002.1 hypothetical protein PAHAL_7G334800 [Panicum hallii]
MFLTEKCSSLLPPHHHHSDAAPPKASRRSRQRQQLLTATKAACFDAALAARLRGLLPGPAPSSPLAALARLADLLALTLAEAAPALAGEGDAAAVAAHLDAGVALLDACNAITARLERLRRRRLLARFALHLLSSSPAGRGRARAALADRDGRSSSSPPPPLPSLPFDQPRGRLSAAARVLVAVSAVSSLAAAAAGAILGEAFLDAAAFPRVSGGDFPWAEPFNAVSGQLSALAAPGASEVDAIDEAVQRLASALDGKGGVDEAAVRAAAQEVERRTEEMTARLDRLSDAVNGVFRAALGLRNAELGSFMVGPGGKTCA